MADGMSDNIYICDLPVGLDEEGVSAIFCNYGQITSVKVLGKGQNWCAALVRYATTEEAAYVVQALNGQVPDGLTTPIKIRYANNSGGGGGGAGGGGGGFGGGGYASGGGGFGGATASAVASPRVVPPTVAPTQGAGGDNLYCCNMPAGLDEESVGSIFKQYGTVVSVKVIGFGAGHPTTAALVRFATPQEAQYVLETLNGGVPAGLTTPITCRYAQDKGGGGGAGAGNGGAGYGGAAYSPPAQRYAPYAAAPVAPTHSAFGGGGKGVGKGGCAYAMDELVKLISESGALPGGDGKDRSQIAEVYVNGLPRDCTDVHLYRIFCSFGQIGGGPKGLTVMKNENDGSCMGYGFVNFLSQESALLAMETLNGTTLPDGKTLKVELKKSGGKGIQ